MSTRTRHERTPIVERIADKFTVGDGCWEWTASRSTAGYGRVARGGRNGGWVNAHRVVYELLVGPIPEGLELDHLCRNRGCVRPDHLEPVTHAENTRRGKGSGAALWVPLPPKTHCVRGHEFTESNVEHYNGHRRCKQCNRNDAREYQRRKRREASL